MVTNAITSIKKLLNISFFIKCLFVIASIFILSIRAAYAQTSKPAKKSFFSVPSPESLIIKYGIASYYAHKFHGKSTASGEKYSHESFTAACNELPLNTWVRITNLSNNKSIIARINDRLHPKSKRLVDLSKSAAEKLGYIAKGLTDVKLEVISEYNPSAAFSQD